ncbi:MAG: CPBP family intramembrane metalloprotease [Planctomycetes bacterium]|jgi:hypothetical protein|nr:CPBP family intramembrane metalloprotease [Planctomycetota bacterium]
MNTPATAAVLAARGMVAFALLAVGPTVAFDVWQRTGAAAPSPGSAAWVEASMIAFLAVALGMVGFARWQPPAWPWRPGWLGAVVRAYAPFLLGWAAVLVGYLELMRGLGQPVAAQTALEYLAAGDPARPGFWLVVAGVVFAAPLAEELVFRGYLQGALREVVSPRAAVLLAALAFGLAHGVHYALPTGLLGVLFGWLVERRGSLWPAVAAHALHNAVVTAVVVVSPGTFELLYRR